MPEVADCGPSGLKGHLSTTYTLSPPAVAKVRLTPDEDYTAGEINEPDKVVRAGRCVGQAQFHMPSYLGLSWCQKPPRFKTAQVVAITRGITDKGGTVTWDVPPAGVKGYIPEEFLTQLKAVGESLAKKKQTE